MDILTAKRVLGQLTEDQLVLLSQAEQGVAVKELDGELLASLHDKGFVRIAPFSNVRAFQSIAGVVLTEDGVKLLEALKQKDEEKRKELADNVVEQVQEEVHEVVKELGHVVPTEKRVFDRKRREGKVPEPIDTTLAEPK